MKAAVLYDFNTPLQIEQFDMPDIADDQVRVRLEASGVCHSDWHIVKGEWVDINRPPVILGHEGAGVVEEVGPQVHSVKVGDHVVLSWMRNCGLCEMCQVGYPNLCEEPWDRRGQPLFPGSKRPMKRMNALGTFSTETIVPQDIAIPIDREIPFSAGGAGRLWGDDRRGSRPKHRQCPARQVGGCLRLWRRWAKRDPGSGDCRSRADYRRRYPGQQTRNGQSIWRHAYGQFSSGKPG